jgi:AraC-like DNA-binding protein
VDRGSVVGVKFRPGGLVALSDTDARSLTDRVVPARDVLSPELCDELRSITEATPNAAACAVVDRALMAVATGVVDPSYETVLELIDDMLRDRTLMRVAQLEQRHAIDRRRLQRLFASYIGVGPKWVLARYRMHDVITALDDGYDGTLVDLAVEYGWYDQAHFNRDFVGLIGVTPGAYRARRATSADCAQGHS